MAGLHIIHLYADSEHEWNCSQHRCLTPADAVNAEHEAGRSPHTAQLFYMPSAIDWANPQVQKKLGMADVLVFQRNVLFPGVWDAMDYFRAIGKAVAVDLDDHYADLPASNPAHTYWIQNKPGLDPDPVSALAEGLRHADALTSPSKVILQDWAHILPGYHVPNYMRRAWYEPLVQKPIGAVDITMTYRTTPTGFVTVDARGASLAGAPSGELVNLEGIGRKGTEGQIMLGWGGSISHVDSWLYSGIIEALDRIFEKHPQARLKFCGHEKRLDYVFARWGDRVVKHTGVRAEHWPSVVATFDIGLAPLDTRPLDPPWREGAPVASYDERRSWLKGVEYLSAGVPWVASDSLTYTDLRRWGTLVANTPDAWFTALDAKIAGLPYAKAEAWDRRRWALRHVTMEANARLYGDTFGRLIAEKQAKSGARLPGVRYVVGKKEAVAA